MKGFIRLALKNVLRNTRRTLLTCFIIALGIAFVYFVRGFINGLQREISQNMTQGMTGEIQISRKGYREALPAKALDYLFTVNEDLHQTILHTPHVQGMAARLQFAGMINHQQSQTTTPFLAIGVDPQAEELVCPRLKDFIRDDGQSHFLDPQREHFIVLAKNQTLDIDEAPMDDIDFSKPVQNNEAKDLIAEATEYHQVLIGAYMQEGFYTNIEANGQPQKRIAQPEDELVIISSDIHGGQKSMPVRLTGIMDSGNPTADKTIIYVMLDAARELLKAPGMATQLILSLDNTENRFDVAAKLNDELAKYDLEAYPWDEIQKFFVNIMDLQNAFFGIIMFVIVLFVIVAIVITSLMTVAERTREIGTLMAIGYRRKHIIRLFLLESLFVSGAGTVAGIIAGLVLIFILNNVGITFTIPGTDTPIIIRPFQTLFFSCLITIVGFISGILGALYPAYHASRLSPVEAMTHI